MSWALSFALLQTFAASAESSQIYRFDIDVHTIYVDVYVTHEGDPVTNLEAKDFELNDNGVRQSLDVVSHDVTPLTAMLLLDISGSVAGEKLNDLRAAAHAFVNRLEPGDEVGLLSFTRRMTLGHALSGDRDGVHRALDRPMRPGETGLNDALYTALKLVEERPGRPLLLIFSDGLENASWLRTAEVVEVVQGSRTLIHVVGVTTPQEFSWGIGGRAGRRETFVHARSYLQRITGATGGRIWEAASTAALEGIYLNILAEVKSRYIIGYRPHGVRLEGEHEIEVKVRGYGSQDVRARPGYTIALGSVRTNTHEP